MRLECARIRVKMCWRGACHERTPVSHLWTMRIWEADVGTLFSFDGEVFDQIALSVLHP
jgi:hypothetical protein